MRAADETAGAGGAAGPNPVRVTCAELYKLGHDRGARTLTGLLLSVRVRHAADLRGIRRLPDRPARRADRSTVHRAGTQRRPVCAHPDRLGSQAPTPRREDHGVCAVQLRAHGSGRRRPPRDGPVAAHDRGRCPLRWRRPHRHRRHRRRTVPLRGDGLRPRGTHARGLGRRHG